MDSPGLAALALRLDGDVRRCALACAAMVGLVSAAARAWRRAPDSDQEL